MATNTVNDLWLAFASTWSSHDPDEVIALYTDDVHYEDVTFGAVNHGKDELRAFAEVVFSGFPDVHFEMTSGFVTDNWGAGEWIMTGTHTGDLPDLTATGKTIAVRGSTIAELRHDKIKRVADYWDLATLLRQIGLAPMAQQAGSSQSSAV
jgi:steroid delta-isomerase-like uncharacterized protein